MNLLCFWVGFRQNIIKIFSIPGFRSKMKRQQSVLGLGFAKKISRVEISEQQPIKEKCPYPMPS